MFKKINVCRNNIWKRKISTRPHVVYDDQTNGFLSVFPDIVDTIFKSKCFINNKQYKHHFLNVLEYTVMKEKRFRPPLLIETYKILEKPENLTKHNLQLMNILAWIPEIIQAYMNTEDDSMDQTDFRCDDVCWHKKDNVGLTSFRDCLYLYEVASLLLKKYFNKTPMYVPLTDLFHEMNQRLVIGQSLDWHWKVNEKLDFSKFNTHLFTTMGRNKGGFIIIETPFRASCILSNNYSKFLKVKNLIERITYVFQVDNDVLDVFQNGTAKIDAGENIRQGQCTWMAVEVLENGSENLKKVFKENYGRIGEEYENKIIRIYYEMGLFDKYIRYKKETLEYINDSVSKMNDQPLQEAILNLYKIMFL
ncbi:hypothetical protein RN001_010207 [Aquatica leii]|uniref:Terpene synthase n=1 Tax=Aquatica leii TaxID=1421715 RepID=A0AAN7P9N0_9COLE|nr:hypothetical protein RN001_010207 [Aquatica leii]